eukprot:COSAG01_NODE_7473_length_3196_cov_2.514046_2_plen_267_part_00
MTVACGCCVWHATQVWLRIEEAEWQEERRRQAERRAQARAGEQHDPAQLTQTPRPTDTPCALGPCCSVHTEVHDSIRAGLNDVVRGSASGGLRRAWPCPAVPCVCVPRVCIFNDAPCPPFTSHGTSIRQPFGVAVQSSSLMELQGMLGEGITEAGLRPGPARHPRRAKDYHDLPIPSRSAARAQRARALPPFVPGGLARAKAKARVEATRARRPNPASSPSMAHAKGGAAAPAGHTKLHALTGSPPKRIEALKSLEAGPRGGIVFR